MCEFLRRWKWHNWHKYTCENVYTTVDSNDHGGLGYSVTICLRSQSAQFASGKLLKTSVRAAWGDMDTEPSGCRNPASGLSWGNYPHYPPVHSEIMIILNVGARGIDANSCVVRNDRYINVTVCSNGSTLVINQRRDSRRPTMLIGNWVYQCSASITKDCRAKWPGPRKESSFPAMPGTLYEGVNCRH